MKLRKSRFRFGSFAFGHSSSSNASSSSSSHAASFQQNPGAPSYPVSTDPTFGHDRLKEESKLRSSSTTSLVRRSSSRVDAIHSSTPVLLAVRKRSCSDSGLDETASGSSQSCSPAGGDRKLHPQQQQKSKGIAAGNGGKSEGGSKMGGGFFRIFNKSATLLFKHPTTELNPNKPYKGTVTTSREHHAITKKASTLGASRRTPEEYHYYRRHQRWPSLTRLEKSSPTPMVAASSSMSSLNSSSIMPLHPHHQAYSSGDDSGRPSGNSGSGTSGGAASTKKDSSSSSNSVISSCSSEAEEEGSNYDSGAFSRTSSPEAASAPISALLNSSTMSISRLPPTEPLCAPSLVIAACLEYGVPMGNPADLDAVDASFVLSCLSAASKSSSSSKTSDVSVTIGANTKLTISPDFEQGSGKRSGQLRRSRSGLPVLGTTALQRTESPSKKVTQRNKISTVYLNSLTGVSSPTSVPHRNRVARSESIVTVSGVSQRRVCECTERVTVNGQHHCCDAAASLGQLVNDFSRFQTSPIVEVASPPETQPNSLIDI